MATTQRKAAGERYWEKETPTVIESDKNQIRFYTEAGKVQVFPRVANSPHGIGKGATICLESMSIEQLQEFEELIKKSIQNQLTTEPQF